MMGTRFGHESRHDKVIRLDFWLTIGRDQHGGAPSVKVTAGYPALNRNERAINLKLSLPLALFETPSITATIDVAAPTQAVTINESALAEAVQQAIGMDVDIRVVNHGENDG